MLKVRCPGILEAPLGAAPALLAVAAIDGISREDADVALVVALVASH